MISTMASEWPVPLPWALCNKDSGAADFLEAEGECLVAATVMETAKKQ